MEQVGIDAVLAAEEVGASMAAWRYISWLFRKPPAQRAEVTRLMVCSRYFGQLQPTMSFSGGTCWNREIRYGSKSMMKSYRR